MLASIIEFIVPSLNKEVKPARKGDFEAEEGIRINPQIEQSLRHSRQ